MFVFLCFFFFFLFCFCFIQICTWIKITAFKQLRQINSEALTSTQSHSLRSIQGTSASVAANKQEKTSYAVSHNDHGSKMLAFLDESINQISLDRYHIMSNTQTSVHSHSIERFSVVNIIIIAVFVINSFINVFLALIPLVGEMEAMLYFFIVFFIIFFCFMQPLDRIYFCFQTRGH